MTSNRVPRLDIEKVLNHTIDDVAEIYHRHDYSDEKLADLEQLSRSLDLCLRRRALPAKAPRI